MGFKKEWKNTKKQEPKEGRNDETKVKGGRNKENWRIDRRMDWRKQEKNRKSKLTDMRVVSSAC